MQKLIKIFVFVLVSLCSSSVVKGTLYFSEDNNPDGLYKLAITNGKATHLGITGTNGKTVGLAPSASVDLLYGSSWWSLMHINADGSGAVDVGGTDLAEGLAYDPTTGTLYGSIHGTFFTIDPATGAKLTNLPASGDTQGLAYANGFVYGLVCSGDGGGTPGDLFKYDIGAASWSFINNIGLGNIDSVGLAYNPLLDILYAKFDGTSLYSINPDTAQPTLIGDTGIYEGGGLAFVPEPATILLLGLGSLALRRCSGQALRRNRKAK
jgi:hypothetical protein